MLIAYFISYASHQQAVSSYAFRVSEIICGFSTALGIGKGQLYHHWWSNSQRCFWITPFLLPLLWLLLRISGLGRGDDPGPPETLCQESPMQTRLGLWGLQYFTCIYFPRVLVCSESDLPFFPIHGSKTLFFFPFPPFQTHCFSLLGSFYFRGSTVLSCDWT